MEGVLTVFKEKGMTSHDVVAKIRKICHTKKVGHGGTLDPQVAGVLPIFIGRATKLNNYLIGNKVYVGELTLGVRTDTDDFMGKTIEIQAVPKLSKDEILKVFSSFQGEQLQKAPMYSARKVHGKKLYEYARAGEQFEITPTPVHIAYLKVKNIDIINKKILFEVECSKGTYIRSLCRDIAYKLNTVGYMSYLIRLKSGFQQDIHHAIPIKFLERMTNYELEENLISVENILSEYPDIQLDKSARFGLINGQTLSLDNISSKNEGLYRIFADEFIGLGKIFLKEGSRVLKMELLFDGR